MINGAILDRDKAVGDLLHTDVLSDRSCREGTTSEVPVDLNVTDLSEEEKRVQTLCQDFRDLINASWILELGKAVGVKQKTTISR